jgi:hypothetical protein
MSGKSRIDGENLDPALRNRPLVTMDMVWGGVFTENQRSGKGLLSGPLKGKTYQCRISKDAPER